MDWLKGFIGKSSVPVMNSVEMGAVRKFAEAIGDENPLYWSIEEAKASVHRRPIAPPTFPRTFDYGTFDGFRLPGSGLIHGEQRFTYFRPIYVGQELCCSSVIKDIYEKAGRIETLTFVVMERKGESLDGALLFTSLQTLILTGQVRRRMQDADN